MRKVLFLFSFIFVAALSFGKNNPHQKEYNFSSFSVFPKKLSAELDAMTPSQFKAHPDYGILPANSPCTNCIEMEDQRDATSRYFIEEGSGGRRFQKQQSYGAINYKDADGWWREINYRLKKKSGKIFEAPNQPSPVAIDMEKKFSAIVNGDKEIRFNKNLELFHRDTNGKEESLGTPDWSRFSAGDDGILVKDFYPGIDLQMIVFEGMIKTNFILNNRLAYREGWLVMKQAFDLPPGCSFNFSETVKKENDQLDGEISITDQYGEYFRIHSSIAYDAAAQPGIISLGNKINTSNELATYIPVKWLKDPNTIYPVVIDPLVSTSLTLAQPSITGSRYNATCWSNGCTYNLNFLSPANCTITNITYNFDYLALGSCIMPDGGVSFNYAACNSPGTGVYNCVSPSPGTCVSGFNSLMSDFAPCLPPPQCAPYNMNFTMNFYRCNNLTTPGCNANCIAAASPWSMVVSGETVRIRPGAFVPNLLICEGDTATLYATAQYGVPGYSYLWSPSGQTSDTIQVSPSSTSVYYILLSDTCGQSITDSVTVNVTQDNNPGFTITPDTQCVGQNITLTGLGSGIAANYDWALPGSNNPLISNSQSASAQYPSQGIYAVTLNYQNGACVFPLSQNVTINSNVTPSVNVSINPAGAVCAGTMVTFSAAPANGGTAPAYQWYLNGTAVPGGTYDTCSVTAAGNNDVMQVVMTSSLQCVFPASASDSVVMNVISNVIPAVSIAVAPNDTACIGDNLQFTALPVNEGSAPSYQWMLNSGAVGINSPSYSSAALNDGDVITVSMTSNAVCASPSNAVSAPVTIHMKPLVAPSVNITAVPPDTVCAGASVTLNATPVNGGASPLYQWHVNGSPGGSNSPAFTSTTFMQGDAVSVTMTSDEDCAAPPAAISNTVIIKMYPPVNVTASANASTCAHVQVTLHATASGGNGGPYMYTWSDGLGNAASVNATPVTNSTYFVYASDACTAAIASVSVNVIPTPVALYSYDQGDPASFQPDIIFTDLSTDAIDWLWIFGDGESSSVQNPIHRFPTSGVYDVSLSVKNTSGCSDRVSFSIIVKENTAFFVPNSFTPNGDGRNETFAPVNSASLDYEMIIFDRWGTEIFHGGPLNPWMGNITGSKEVAPEGIYIYSIHVNDSDGDRTILGRVTLVR